MVWMALIMGLPLLGLVLFLVYPWWVALTPYLILVGASVLFDRMMMRAMRLPVRTGRDALIGSTAVVLNWKGDSGQVAWRGEIWRAAAQRGRTFAKGERVIIEDLSQLTLVVKSVGPDVQTGSPSGVPRNDCQV